MVQIYSRPQDDNRAFGVRHSIIFDPIPQARHRMVFRGTRVHAYDPNVRDKMRFHSVVKDYLCFKYNASYENFPLTTSCVKVDVSYFISRPDCHFVGPDRTLGIDPRYENTMPLHEGDIDNYDKFFLDAIDQIFFSNDRNVVDMHSKKFYTMEDSGRVVFTIRRQETNVVNLVDDVVNLVDDVVNLVDDEDEN
jgi:Holliday junction resolvase RusA-like endonuclease